MRLLIKNGIIVTSERTFKSDILIKGGFISEISENISNIENAEIINAEDKYIFPGGIDPHVHMHLPTPAGYSADDFYTGSKAALFGGTTTIIDFVTPRKAQSLIEALNERKKEAENSVIDYSFHVSPVDWHKNIENEIEEVIKAGITSFKVYTAYKNSIGLEDDVLLKVMKTVADAGGIITVHAENGDEIEELRNAYAEQNKLSPEYHALSRPNRSESEAVKKVIAFAEQTNCIVYIVHVSTKESVEYIKEAQKKGVNVYGETCPQYLLLDDSKLKGKFEETAKFVFSPPLRKKEDNNALWNALKDKTIQTVGTDHCPFTFEQKKQGENDFRKIPNGAGGVEHRLSLLYTYGVLENKINLNEFVALTSTNAAKIFGLYPKKGEIAIGSDADIIIWDKEAESVISAKKHHQNCDLNIFESAIIKGKTEFILLKGNIVFKNNQLSLQKANKGNFLKR
ncbi:MAG: dihydropyrimidinase [Bacteroidales bacterium]|nr:dihydropyrimidinase [Bacteroidales bacterium]